MGVGLEIGLRANNMGIERQSVVDLACSMQVGFVDALVESVVIETGVDHEPFDELDAMGNTHLMLMGRLSCTKPVAFGYRSSDLRSCLHFDHNSCNYSDIECYCF